MFSLTSFLGCTVIEWADGQVASPTELLWFMNALVSSTYCSN